MEGSGGFVWHTWKAHDEGSCECYGSSSAWLFVVKSNLMVNVERSGILACFSEFRDFIFFQSFTLVLGCPHSHVVRLDTSPSPTQHPNGV